ncbi:MAG: AAA family ATPase [Planctomycetaceae bacterium]
MYVSHFGFHRQPFHSADAGRAFFVSESIRNILPQLLHALRSDLGIAVLTGVPGSGKTSLLRHIQQQISNEGRAIVCSGASLSTSAELFSVLLEASRKRAGTAELSRTVTSASSLQESRSEILEQLRRSAELWGPVLLLIDDAQLVPLPVLNELRACTEEEWNGRDLVRCLVSAPIVFEEQLARAEYAEFSRRIRCHAFLEPFRSSESLRFLQEQIELVGGRLSQVFTTSALELISSAAAGIPRCLSLLADESLVVAMQNDELITSEKSVRRALGRLQHLQYHWNASPDSDITDISTDISTTENPLSSVSQQPMQLSGSAGVVEFGTRSVDRSCSAKSPAATECEPTSNCASLAPGVVEFGGPVLRSNAAVAPPSADLPAETIAEEASTVTPATSAESRTTFEVGRRFFAESSSDSVSIENFGDSEASSGTGIDGLEIYWIDGNAHVSIPESAADDVDLPLPAEVPASAQTWIGPGETAEGQTLSEPRDNKCVYTPTTDFIDLGDSRQSVCTPVFDRYTWIALGREIPPGITSSGLSDRHGMSTVSGTPSAIHAGIPFESMPNRLRPLSIDHIPVTRTTDEVLLDQIRKNSLEIESGAFVAIQQEPQAAGQVSEVPALKLWHDGQLIFPETTERESVIEQETELAEPVLPSGAKPSTAPRQISAGGFFTLPIPVDRIELDLRALDSADDSDVFPIVETLAGLRAEMREFQQTGRTFEHERSGRESGSAGSHENSSADRASDDLLARAKRRLDEPGGLEASTMAAVQLASVESRPMRETCESVNASRAPEAEEDAGKTLQLSRLFTRLWETRRQDTGDIVNP